MGIALLVLLVLGILVISWLRNHPEKVQQWVARRMMKNFEKRMNAAAAKERNTRQQQQRSSSSRKSSSRRNGHIIPPEYAQDVEYTETRVFHSETEINASEPGKVKVESQVSDVEWEEIKSSPRKKN